MMAAFLQRIKGTSSCSKVLREKELTAPDLGAKGCFIIPPASNVDAVRFYKRHGFRLFDEVMDDGESGQAGYLKDGSICLVHNL